MCHYYMKLNIMSTSFRLYDGILTYQSSADRRCCVSTVHVTVDLSTNETVNSLSVMSAIKVMLLLSTP